MGCLNSSHSLWFSCADLDGLCDQWRNVSWDICKFNASAATDEFCEWV